MPWGADNAPRERESPTRRRASPWGINAGDGTLGEDYPGDLHTVQDPWPAPTKL